MASITKTLKPPINLENYNTPVPANNPHVPLWLDAALPMR
jgi:hypothetical protein